MATSSTVSKIKTGGTTPILTKPVVHPEIRKKIPDGQVSPAELASAKEKHSSGDGETQVAQHDQFGILSLVQWARGVEMVDTAKQTVPLTFATTLWLTFVVVVTGGVGGDVIWPAHDLLAD